ncbi:MAG: aldehyde dehydrogenase family protein [Chthonomonas sp.]|nr:aldehyde dehydrogenase family protein [Chthonomonas sp.]
MSQVGEILDSMDYGPAPEAANFANEWLDKHGRKFGHYLGGKWVPAESHFASICPSTGKELAQIGQGSSAQVDEAVKAAREGLKAWTKLGPAGRSRVLYALARQIQKHSRLFAVLESLDNGKPIRETRDIDIPLVARHFYYHAGWARLIETEFPEYENVGVCGQIIPWNFPLLMLSWKIAPALAAGNAVILKPAEFTSLSALLFAEICHQVGVPAGVVNIITGDGETGKAMVAHEGIDKIAFTGSTEVGRILRRVTAGTGKKLSLELGGKSPFIVFEDADVDSAIEGIVDAIWFNQGQVCCAGSRLLVQESIADRFYKKLRRRMESLRVGDPLDKAVDIGAIVDATQLARITELVGTGVKEGAKCFQPKCKFPEGGWFYPPTLLTDVEPSSTVAQVEIFGPVLVAMTFRTPAEAVALANNTVYGLASSVWTQNLDVAHDIAAQIKAGTVWVNCTNQFDANAGFGGYRESGFGRESGREGMFEYLRWRAPYLPAGNLAEIKESPSNGALDRTHKLFIGGKQARPDGGYSISLPVASGGVVEVSRGNRKDIRNAVEAAATAAPAWGAQTGYLRSQILYFLAENMEANRAALETALTDRGGSGDEVTKAIDAALLFAGWADKHEGTVHPVPLRAVTYTRPEVLGVVGVVCEDAQPLLGFVSSVAANLAMGNAVVVIPSRHNPLAAMEMMRVIEASDIPSGVLNIVTGQIDELVPDLAGHAGVDALWCFADAEICEQVEQMSVSNLKQTWCLHGHSLDWTKAPSGEILRRATQLKNIWVPYGA